MEQRGFMINTVCDRFFFQEISIHECHAKYTTNYLAKDGIMKASIFLECYSWLEQRKLENNFKCQEYGLTFYTHLHKGIDLWERK